MKTLKQTRLPKLVAWAAALSCASLLSLQAIPIITDVVETGGDNEDTDTVTAKWTGVTFVSGKANEPIPGTAAEDPYTVGLFEDLAPAMVDRSHAYTGAAPDLPIPDYLLGNEYIMIRNDNKNTDPFQLDVTVSEDCLVYLLIDNRCGDGDGANPPTIGPGTEVMEWVDPATWVPMLTGWNRMHNPDQPDEIGIDEGRNGDINQQYSVYRTFVPGGSVFSTYEQNDGGGRNMYGIVVAPAPEGPELVTVSAWAVGFTATIDDYGMATLDEASLQVQLDGETVTVSPSKVYTFTRAGYTLPEGEVFPPGSEHTVVVSAQDTEGKSYEWTASFTVPEYPVIPAEWALDSASDPGMNVGIYQMDVGRGGNHVADAEQQWARGYIDPLTGEPYENMAFVDTDEVDYVNWEQEGLDIDDTPEDGPDHFNSALPADGPIPNDFMPGLPGFSVVGDGVDNVTIQVTTYLYLTKGYYKMGVNSDDGFRVSVAPGQPDVFGMTLGLFDGGRGAADTLFDFVVTQDGYYPFRLLYWEGGSGANVEWFTVNQQTGEYLLINGPQSGAVKAYKTAAGRAHLSKMLPAPGWTGFLSAGDQMQWVLEDGSTTVDRDSIKLLVDGEETAGLNISQAGGVTTVAWPVSADYGLHAHTGAFIWAESNGATWTNEFSFSTVKDWKEGEITANLIVNVTETGGDAEQVDTLVAQWTGQTFVNGVANEPRLGSEANDLYTVGLFVEGAPAFVDRPHIWVSADPETPIPDYLVGGEYVMIGNDNKNNDPFQLDITVNPPVMAYLLIDNRLGDDNSGDPPALGDGTMDWVLNDGWEPVKTGANPFGNPDWPDMVGIDENADGTINGYDSIYRKKIDTSSFSTYECITGNNIYGVVITEVPAAPPEIRVSLNAEGQVVLEWEGEAVLQQAEQVTGPWADVAEAASPFTVDPSAGKMMFFRLRQP